MARYTIIWTGDTTDLLDLNGRWPQAISDIERLLQTATPYMTDNIMIHVTEGDTHSFGSEIGGLANQGMDLINNHSTDDDILTRVHVILNEIDSRASIWED